MSCSIEKGRGKTEISVFKRAFQNFLKHLATVGM